MTGPNAHEGPAPSGAPLTARRRARTALAALAVAGAAGWLGVAIADANGADGAPYLIVLALGAVAMVAAWWLARRVPRRTAVTIVVLGAVAFRLAQVWVPPELSDDLYRYLWDGQVQLDGTNPYVHAPIAEELQHLRDDDVWPLINRRPVPTIYPPGSQTAFAGLRLLGVARPATLKLAWVLADLAVMWLLVRVLRRAGRDERLLVLYAWNPMVVLAFAHEGHVDVLAVLAVVAAVHAWQHDRPRAVGVALGVAGAVKLFPLLLVPAFMRRADTAAGERRIGLRWTVPLAAAGVLAVAYVPYVLGAGQDVIGFLTTDGYLREEGYVSGRRFVAAAALGVDGIPFALAVGGVVAFWAVISGRAAAAKGAFLLGCALLLTTPYPWYATTMVALAVAGGPGVGVRSAMDRRRWAELIWPLFGVGLEVVYVSIAHPYGPSTTVQRQVLIAATVVALLGATWAARRSPTRVAA